MALVKKLSKITMDRNIIHGPVDCSYTVFTDESGGKYLQIDTYGSKTRKIKGKKSQSIQFNENSLRELMEIIRHIL
jgi:hypothetical protein